MPEWLVKLLESDKLWSAVIGGGAAWVVTKLTTRSKIDEVQASGIVRAAIEEPLQQQRMEGDRKLEALRHEMTQERLVHEVRFRTLYEKVADAIEKTFYLVADVLQSGSKATQFASYRSNQYDVVRNHFAQFEKDASELSEHLRTKHLFLPKTMYDLVQAFSEEVGRIVRLFSQYNVPNPDLPANVDLYQLALEELGKLGVLYLDLCEGLQKYIGLDDVVRK